MVELEVVDASHDGSVDAFSFLCDVRVETLDSNLDINPTGQGGQRTETPAVLYHQKCREVRRGVEGPFSV